MKCHRGKNTGVNNNINDGSVTASGPIKWNRTSVNDVARLNGPLEADVSQIPGSRLNVRDGDCEMQLDKN